MTLPDLLSACRAAGVELFLDGDGARYRAPAGALIHETGGRREYCRGDVTDRPCAPVVASPGSIKHYQVEEAIVGGADLGDYAIGEGGRLRRRLPARPAADLHRGPRLLARRDVGPVR